ncbi:MAG: type IV pilus secretin PilQ [Nitrospirota bacterium]
MKSKSFFIHLCIVALAGCAVPNTQVVAPASEPVTALTDLRVEELSDVTRLVLTGDGPLNYTAFRLDEPMQLILDLSETVVGTLTAQRQVGIDPVTEILAAQSGDDQRIARLSIGLSRPADYQIARDEAGTVLTVDFVKAVPAEPSAVPSVVEEISPPTAADAAPTSPTAAASRINAIRIAPQKTFVDVAIEADGALTAPNVFAIGATRLVIDLPGVESGVKPSVVKAQPNTLVTQARVGQHRDPQKVRVVLDLKKAVTYTVTPRDAGISVRLASVTAGPSPAVPPAPVELEPVGPPASAAPPPMAPVAVPAAEPAAPQPVEPSAPVAQAAVEATGPQTIGGTGFSGQKISLDFQDAEIANVLRLIADVSDLNMVVGDEVKGKITLKLFNVPWDQALDIILKSKGFGQVREGNIMRIDSNASIAKQQDEALKAKEAQVKAEDLKTAIIPINYAKAADLATTLKKNLSARGELTVNEPTNSLIAKDVEKNINEIQQLIALLDLAKPQVLIETRIVQANTNFARDLGVQWGAAYSDTPGSNLLNINAGAVGDFNSQTPTFAVNLPASGGAGPIGNVGVQFGRLSGALNLDLRLSAGEALGETKIISSPRVVTIDNKEAVIQQGDSIPYETVSDKGTQTQFVDATLNLTVTPHITPNGSVIMKIKATKNAIGSFASSRTGAPSISKREASTEVMVQDGETTVIGGIFETTKTESLSGVPWIHRIPLIGWLFKRESTSTSNQELLIFITPTIVKGV